MPTLELDGASKVYGEGEGCVIALDRVNLRVEQGEFVAIVGPSGAGKSTILNLLALLDTPTDGRVLIDGSDPSALSAGKLASLRSATFGFVFQGFHLIDELPVLDNVMLGLRYRGIPIAAQQERAHAALEQVGLDHRSGESARNLSGGQRQRVAIARAIVADAPVLVADEPTGNLDSTSASEILDLLTSIARSGRTVIIVTHSADVAGATDRRIVVRDGGIAADDGSARGPTGLGEPRAVGRDSVLKARDLWVDASNALVSRLRRQLALILAVAVAVGLATATYGLGQSARAQVASNFDVLRNRQVTAHLESSQRPLDEYVTSLTQVTGIEAAGVSQSFAEGQVRRADQTAALTVPVYAVTSQFPAAAGLRLRNGGRPDGPRDGEALVGEALAERLALGPTFASPEIVVNGRSLTVVGIIEDAPRTPEVVQSVVVASGDPARSNPLEPGAASSTTVQLLTRSGAARQVASQLAIALEPYTPETVRVEAPPDPASSRDSIESTVSAVMVALAVVAVLAAAISLMNTMTASVGERLPELGLRRALGARPAHLRALLFAEASVIGVAGGVVGLFLGLVGVLAVSMTRGWSPVFEPLLVPAALVGGVLVAVVSALSAVRRAARVQPVQALRA